MPIHHEIASGYPPTKKLTSCHREERSLRRGDLPLGEEIATLRCASFAHRPCREHVGARRHRPL
ncbi:MAG: hypothetical protein QGD88_12620, partial [Anaerolineae bacterium]|nr:hypothetical protein [Anaerolineae bacterium]